MAELIQLVLSAVGTIPGVRQVLRVTTTTSDREELTMNEGDLMNAREQTPRSKSSGRPRCRSTTSAPRST